MKTIQKKWLSLFLLAAVTFLFPACEGNLNNPDDDSVNGITIKMRNDYGDEIKVSNGASLYISTSNNFVLSARSGGMVDVGKKNLNQITKAPSTYPAMQVAVLEGHGYVCRAEMLSGLEGLETTYFITKYLKLYVKHYITDIYSNIIGAEVQYCEWDPEE